MKVRKLMLAALLALVVLTLLSWWLWTVAPCDPDLSPSSLKPRHILVIGGGLAGCVTSLALAQRGHQVTLYEQSADLGGNSMLASSGINAVSEDDSVSLFQQDTERASSRPGPLAKTLAQDSVQALAWLQDQGVQLDQTVQLGGHSVPRTRRSSGVMSIGSVLMSTLILAVDQHPHITVHRLSPVTALWKEAGQIRGLVVNEKQVSGDDVVLCMGGFASNQDWIGQLQPHLAAYPTTSGEQAHGTLLRTLLPELQTRDLDSIQVHPTGFVDPRDPQARTKVLAAEILRGVGGQLYNDQGERFCDELSTRKEIHEAMMEQQQSTFLLVVPRSGYEVASKHIDFYLQRQLLHETDRGYEGTVTPVVHYCQGGVSFDADGHILDKDGSPIPHLWGAGEVTGGLHGENRLGGNSLLECVVYGIRIAHTFPPLDQALSAPLSSSRVALPVITLREVSQHNTAEDFWIALDGQVYRVPTHIVAHHPGPESFIRDFAGKDVSQAFHLMHDHSIIPRLEPQGTLACAVQVSHSMPTTSS